MKIWATIESGNEKIIAFVNNTIYRGNPKSEEIETAVLELKIGHVPTDNFFGIDLYEILQINLQEGKPYIEIYFGKGSYEHFRIKDINKRNEIFNYFKGNIPGLVSSEDRFTKLKAGKKPLIAATVVTVLFLWSLFLSIDIERGVQYDVEGGRYGSFAGIVLGIASLGTVNTILIFGSLLAIALFSTVRKMRNPPVIHRLTKVRK